MKKTCNIAGIIVELEYQFDEYFKDNLDSYASNENPEYQIISCLVDEIKSLEGPYMRDQHRRFFRVNQEEFIQVINQDNIVRYQIHRDDFKKKTIISQVPSLSKNPPEMEYIFISMVFLELANTKGFVALHASSVVVDDEVYLFSAPSQTGKSTHARNYLKHFKQAFILNDDKPLIKNNLVYGTPFSGKEKKNKNQKYPIKAIYFIEQGQHDEIKPLGVEVASRVMMKNILRPSDEKTWDLIIPHINQTLSEVPIYQTQLTLDDTNVYMTYYEPNKEKTMKIKTGFAIKEVGNQFMVLPVGEGALNFNGIMTLNKTGKFLFELLQSEIALESLVSNMTERFDVSEEVAKKDVVTFIETLKSKGLIE